jgi:hypothetical protein
MRPLRNGHMIAGLVLYEFVNQAKCSVPSSEVTSDGCMA